MAKRRKKSKMPAVLILLVLLVVAGFFGIIKSYTPDNSEAVQAIAAVDIASPEITFDKDDEYLILVNKTHSVPSDFRPDDMVRVNAVAPGRSGERTMMRKVAAEAFNELTAAAKADGYTIVLTSGYRSYTYQKSLYNTYLNTNGKAWTERYSAKPGTSEHHTGLAVDVSTPGMGYALGVEFAGTAEADWIEKHCHEYGFILRYGKGQESITGYAYEPWHIRYVGKEAATVIHSEGITFEEFWKKYLEQ